MVIPVWLGTDHGMGSIISERISLGGSDPSMEDRGCVHALEEAWSSLLARVPATPRVRPSLPMRRVQLSSYTKQKGHTRCPCPAMQL
jgi:hypothetical protein